MFYDVLFPCFVAGIVGYHVALYLGGVYAHEVMPQIPVFSGWSLFEIIMLGVWCGLAALLLIEVMKLGEKLFGKLAWHWSFKALLGGVLLIAIGKFISPNYLGLGLDTLSKGMHGEVISGGALLWKSIATSITLGSGGSGGVVTPIFFVGTAAGNLFAQLFSPEYLAAYSAIGMVALLAGAANTRLRLLSWRLNFLEMDSPICSPGLHGQLPDSRYRSIYPSQVLGSQKSSSLLAPTGKPMNEIGNVTLKTREKSLVGLVRKIKKRK